MRQREGWVTGHDIRHCPAQPGIQPQGFAGLRRVRQFLKEGPDRAEQGPRGPVIVAFAGLRRQFLDMAAQQAHLAFQILNAVFRSRLPAQPQGDGIAQLLQRGAIAHGDGHLALAAHHRPGQGEREGVRAVADAGLLQIGPEGGRARDAHDLVVHDHVEVDQMIRIERIPAPARNPAIPCHPVERALHGGHAWHGLNRGGGSGWPLHFHLVADLPSRGGIAQHHDGYAACHRGKMRDRLVERMRAVAHAGLHQVGPHGIGNKAAGLDAVHEHDDAAPHLRLVGRPAPA